MTEILLLVLPPSDLVFQENALFVSSGSWIISDVYYPFRDNILEN